MFKTQRRKEKEKEKEGDEEGGRAREGKTKEE